MSKKSRHFDSERFDDEVNLFAIAESLWSGKFWILLVVALSLLIGAGFVFIPDHPSITSIHIKPLLASDMGRYTLINKQYGLSDKKYELNLKSYNLISKQYELLNKRYELSEKSYELRSTQYELINKQYELASKQIEMTNKGSAISLDGPKLLGLFASELRLRRSLAQAISETGYLKVQAGETTEQFQRRVVQLANSISLFPRTANNNGDIEYSWQLRFGTSEPAAAREMVAFALSLTNEKIREAILRSIAAWQKELAIEQGHLLQVTEIKRRNAIEDYDRKIESRVSFLEEQAQIAQASGIVSSTMIYQELDSDKSTEQYPTRDSLFYLRGYTAIETEIEQIRSRSNKEHFVPELVIIDKQLRMLKQDSTQQKITDALVAAELTPEKFRAAYFDVREMVFVPTVKFEVVFIFFGVFGLLAGSLGLLLCQGMRRFLRKDAN